MLKPLALYMLFYVFNYLMILSALFEVQFSSLSKVILDDFVWMKGILFIKNKLRSMFLCCSNISVGSVTLGALLVGFLRCFMPLWRSDLTGPYM